MDVHAGPRIYRLVADNHARECTVRRQPLHACMFEYHFTTLMWSVRQKSYTPHTKRDRFMTCHCTSHFDSMGGIHAYTCMCVCSNCIMHVIPEHDLYIYIYIYIYIYTHTHTVLQAKNNPLLSQINSL